MRFSPCFAFVFTLLLLPLCATAQVAPAPRSTFHNPLLPSGPDPWVTEADGWYYVMVTTGKDLRIYRTRDMSELRSAENRVVWTPPSTGPYTSEIWAPELHRIAGKWYIYVTADAGKNEGHRIWVLENAAGNPLEGTWTVRGKIGDSGDHWAIDASVFEDHGVYYMIWSGWPGDHDAEQRIYIARMRNPWTLGSERTELSRPQFPWEMVGDLPDRSAMPHLNVNEGPEMLKHGGDLFLIYSASACWTDYYALGMLRAKSGVDLLNPHSWTKSSDYVFRGSPEAAVYGAGHNSFFRSPDGREDWILYHANPARIRAAADNALRECRGSPGSRTVRRILGCRLRSQRSYRSRLELNKCKRGPRRWLTIARQDGQT